MDLPTVVINIGNKLRYYRYLRGMTLEELAERSGLYPGHIGDIERGVRRNPSLETLNKIANGLSIELIQLFEYTDSNIEQEKLRAIQELCKILSHTTVEDTQFITKLVSLIIMWKTDSSK